MMKRIFLVLTLLLWTPLAQADDITWSNYAGLLHDFVQKGEKEGVRVHLVNYTAWKHDARWKQALKTLANADVSSLHSQNERLSFWFNAYNMMAIKKVLEHWPIESIRDEGSFFHPVWKQDVGIVAGQMRTLNEIEHKILRPMGEPLMHVAIVCASVSCPDLRTEPYDAKRLNVQLHEQAVLFLSNQKKGLYVDADGLHLSKIFDWFADDFSNVPAWIHQYRSDIQADRSIASYLPYNWHVNAL